MSLIQKYVFWICLGFAILTFILHFLVVKTSVYGDGRYYYSYLPTLLIEHTFNFSKSFNFYGLPFVYTPTHFLQNPLPIGPAITWTIPYLIGFSTFNLFHNSNAYNVFLQIFVGIWSVSLVFVGLFFLYLSLQKFFSKNLSFLVTLTILFASNLFFYGAIDVINSHSSSFLFACLSVYLWLSKISLKNSVILGLSLGMLTLSHTQDIIFLILPIATLLVKKEKYAINFFVILVAIGISLIPQSFLWQILWGNAFKSPFSYTFVFDFLRANILGVLFNLYDGFFLWTPIIIFAFFGLLLFSKKHKALGFPMFTIILIEIYLIASWNIWWEGASYSARIFIPLLPLLAFGLAHFYKKFLSEKKQLLFSLFFSILNMILIIFFLLKVK